MGFIDRLRRIATTWYLNTVNTLVYLLSAGRTTLHEGRFSGGLWSNWSRTFEARPRRFEAPRTEEALRLIVQSSQKVRLVGAGHTFNASPLTDGTMVSLDAYDQLLEVDREKGIVRAQAGIRLRDLTARLQDLGLALPVLGSTNAQSLGGLIATDLHGTGRDHGFLSEQVRSLRIMNAAGEARTYRPEDEELHAAIGAIGACGLVLEVELQCVPAYNLAKAIQVVDRAWAESNLDRLLQEHDHLSFYYIGGVDVGSVRMNLWDETPKAPSFAWRLRKVVLEVLDMLLSGYLLGLARAFMVADLFASVGLFLMRLLLNRDSIVMPSAAAFSRQLYYRHDELEYGVPYEVHQQCLNEVLALLRRRRAVMIIEVRFAPDRSQGLLGPGVGRRTCFIELAPSLSTDPSGIFAEAEQILLKYGGQLHLGKATNVGGAELARMYGARWRTFREVQRRQDPEGKFVNPFVERLFADGTAAGAEETGEALRAAS